MSQFWTAYIATLATLQVVALAYFAMKTRARQIEKGKD